MVDLEAGVTSRTRGMAVISPPGLLEERRGARREGGIPSPPAAARRAATLNFTLAKARDEWLSVVAGDRGC